MGRGGGGGGGLLLFEYPHGTEHDISMCIMYNDIPHGTQITKDGIPHGTEHPHSTHDIPMRIMIPLRY